jgi:thioredoxin reductase (NADPH)
LRENEYDAVIIGGGPAGATAGLYASRSGMKTVVLEKGMKGGPYSVTEEIENYPGFPEGIKSEELMDRFQAQAERFGVDFKTFTQVAEMVKEGDLWRIKSEDDEEVTGKTVIIATGSVPSPLKAKGEKEFTGRGVSYCATCDGPLFKDKKVLVIGGGNAAVEEAIFLTKFCSSVTIVHRRGELRADAVIVKRAEKNPKISFRLNSVLIEVRGETLVKEAILKDTETGKEETVSIDGVFIFVGANPVTEFLPPEIKLDERGFIETGADLMSSVAGVFAAGNCRAGSLKQIVWAAGEGAMAAVSCERYLEGDKKGASNG